LRAEEWVFKSVVSWSEWLIQQDPFPWFLQAPYEQVLQAGPLTTEETIRESAPNSQSLRQLEIALDFHVRSACSGQDGDPPLSGCLECRVFRIETDRIRHQLKQRWISFGESDVGFSQFNCRISSFVRCLDEFVRKAV
jgi:hypothetical protein